MKKTCPHCGSPVGAPWHSRHGLAKLEKGWVEAGLPLVGKVKLRKQVLVMVYVCSRANLPFLVVLPGAK